MDQFKQITAFVNVANRGSLSAAARLEGVTPAIIGRRLDSLEERLGAKLLLRTTRRVSLTYEGSAFLEECQRILRELEDAEASVSAGSVRPRGHLRLSAPAGFGRKHLAPLLTRFVDANPGITARLDLSDRLVDLVEENVDCAVRIGELKDSSLISINLGEMRRVIVASPDYLARHAVPPAPTLLNEHNCLTLSQQRGWTLLTEQGVETIKVGGTLECNDGAVLREWALDGRGLAWRSWWEVGEDIAAGRLVTVLDEFAAPPVGIYAVVPQRRHLPLRVRLLVEFLKAEWRRPGYWDGASSR